MEFVEGQVVICGTGQCGTIAQKSGKEIWILLRNGDLFVGQDYQIRVPQSQEDLDSCPLNVDRVETKRETRER